jgi:hypothetical protein
MKKRFNYISIIALAMLFFMVASSCTNILEQQAVDSFTEDGVFQDIGTVQAFLVNCYDQIGGPSSEGILQGRDNLLDTSSDFFIFNHSPGNISFVKGTLSPDYLRYFSGRGGWSFSYLSWRYLYSNLQNVNLFLARVDECPATTTADQTLITKMKGEAYFLRAFTYTQLLRGHGGVVLADQPFNLGEDFTTMTRSTIEETKDFIVADIDKAIDLLPDQMEQGHATRAAAAALKVRLLAFCSSELMNGGYEPTNMLVSFPAGSRTALLQATRDAAKEIMDGTYGNFALVGTTDDPPSPLTQENIESYAENYFNLFNQKGAWNSESIWGIQYVQSGGNYWRPNLWYGPNGYHNWGGSVPTELAIREYEMADGTPFVWDTYSPGDNVLRTATAAELEADPLRSPYNGREPRFYGTILYHGAKWSTRPADILAIEPTSTVETGNFYYDDGTERRVGIDTRAGIYESWNGTLTGYYIKKFQDPALEGQYFCNTNHYIEMRYAEVLLDYAEACIELGGADLQNGLDALNMVRNRAGLPDRVTNEQATAREYVRHERTIELFGEGFRFFDIRRWKIAENLIENTHLMEIKQFDNGNMEWYYNLNANSDVRAWGGNKCYWLPIDRTEMNRCQSLQQNPGYE